MSKPQYQSLTNAHINKLPLHNNSGLLEVIAGEYNGVKGSASTFMPVHLYNAKLNKGGKTDFSFPAHYSTGLLVIEGSIKVNGTEEVFTNYFVLFENDGEEFLVEAPEDAAVLLLSGDIMEFFEVVYEINQPNQR